MVKNLAANVGAAGDMGLIHGVGQGRSPGRGNGYSTQYSCLENSMDRRDWRDIAHGVAIELDITEQLSHSLSLEEGSRYILRSKIL